MPNPIFCYSTHARIIRSILEDFVGGNARSRVTPVEQGYELQGQTGGIFVLVDGLPVPTGVMDMVRQRGCLVWTYDDHYRREVAIREHAGMVRASDQGEVRTIEFFGGARFLGKNAIHIPLEPVGTFASRLDDQRIEQELAGEGTRGMDLSREAFKYLITINQIDYAPMAVNDPRWPHFHGTRVYVGNSIYNRPKIRAARG